MTAKLLTEHHLEFLSLKVGCPDSSESTLIQMLLLEITCGGSYILISLKFYLLETFLNQLYSI